MSARVGAAVRKTWGPGGQRCPLTHRLATSLGPSPLQRVKPATLVGARCPLNIGPRRGCAGGCRLCKRTACCRLSGRVFAVGNARKHTHGHTCPGPSLPLGSADPLGVPGLASHTPVPLLPAAPTGPAAAAGCEAPSQTTAGRLCLRYLPLRFPGAGGAPAGNL